MVQTQQGTPITKLSPQPGGMTHAYTRVHTCTVCVT